MFTTCRFPQHAPITPTCPILVEMDSTTLTFPLTLTEPTELNNQLRKNMKYRYKDHFYIYTVLGCETLSSCGIKKENIDRRRN